MSKVLVSGNVNLETNVEIANFPIEYKPVRYPNFGIMSKVGGVAYNVSKSLATLGDDVVLLSMIGDDFEGEHILKTLQQDYIDASKVQKLLRASAVSVILHDIEGKRSIYTDTKNLQQIKFDFDDIDLTEYDLIVACNVEFNRPLLRKANELRIPVATDVHVVGDLSDKYNQEFLSHSDIVFLSDEAIPWSKPAFIKSMKDLYPNIKIIVMGMGKNGAMMYLRLTDKVYILDPVKNHYVVNTLGAGDALFSSFIHFYQAGFNAVDALKRAEVFASYKVSFNGASIGFLKASEVENRMSDIEINIVTI